MSSSWHHFFFLWFIYFPYLTSQYLFMLRVMTKCSSSGTVIPVGRPSNWSNLGWVVRLQHLLWGHCPSSYSNSISSSCRKYSNVLSLQTSIAAYQYNDLAHTQNGRKIHNYLNNVGWIFRCTIRQEIWLSNCLTSHSDWWLCTLFFILMKNLHFLFHLVLFRQFAVLSNNNLDCVRQSQK